MLSLRHVQVAGADQRLDFRGQLEQAQVAPHRSRRQPDHAPGQLIELAFAMWAAIGG